MKSFLLAVQFLTAVPIKIKQIRDADLPASLIYFPVIGLLLGSILVGLDSFFAILNFGQLSINIILVVALVILTSGLHLDGLSDTFDALLSRKDKEEMLKIMKDSRIGVMGALSILCVLLLKISFLSGINTTLKHTALFLMCIIGRWSLIFSLYLFPYARNDGTAKKYFEGINGKIFISGTILALIFVFLIGHFKGLLIFFTTAVCIYLVNKSISKKIGGITGDSLGAVNELSEALALLMICITERMVI